jgi:hypothetical protein
LPLYFDAIIANMGAIEIVTRHPSFVASLSQTFLCIQLLTRCVKAVGNFHESSVKESFFKSLVDIFEGKTETGNFLYRCYGNQICRKAVTIR